MTVSGMNSASASTLFSSLSSSGGGLYSTLSDYNSIKSGSYGKLLGAYYNQTGSQSVSSNSKPKAYEDNTSRGYRERYLREQELKQQNSQSSSSTSSTVSASQSNSTVASSSKEMVSAIDKLNESDTFKTNTAGEYNVDDIYKTVKSYVDSYNNALEGSKTSTVSGVSSNVSSMTNVTNMYSKSLESIGVTVGSDKKLSLDETAFKNADMSKVKDVFGRGNYGYSVRTNAYMANYYATQAQNASTTYGSNGTSNLSDILSSFQSYI